MLRSIRDHPLAVFYVLAFALAWCIKIPVAVSKTESVVLCLLPSFFPAIAALIAAAISAGRAGVKGLLSQICRFRVSPAWYVIALAGPMALNLLAVITATLFGRPYPKVDLPSIRVVPVILLATFFALGEELGWRGFALPRLQARFGALVASLMVGLLWWAWHLPEILAGPSQGLSPQQIASLEFRDLAIDLAASILMAWVYNNTRGSLFLVALFHVGIGLLSEFVTLPSASSLTFIDIVLTAGLWLIAAILIQIPRVYFPLEKPEAL